MSTTIDASSPIPGGLPAPLERSRAAQTPAAGSSASKPAGGSSRGDDTVQITGDAMQLQTLDKAVSGGPVINSQRVEALRLAIAEGRYTINPERIAAKMMSAEAALA